MSAPEKPESAKIDVTDLLNLKEKVERSDAPGLMAAPSMAKPAAPATAMSAAMAEGINKTLQSVLSADPDVPYVIQAGDTLSEIAVKTGTTVEDLVKENKIEKADDIFTGNELKIPSAKSTKTKEDIVSSLTDGMSSGDYLKSRVGKEGSSFEGEGVETATFTGSMIPGLSYLDRFFGNPPEVEIGGYDEMPSIYSKAVNSMSSILKQREGTKPHIGSDWDNVTLALGIVPDKGLKMDGKVVPSDRKQRGAWLKKNGYVDNNNKPTQDFMTADIDTSGAVKNGIKRSTFNSDEEWSKAVINNFEKAPRESFEGFDDLPQNEQKALIDTAWNMGKGAYTYNEGKGYSGIESLLNEAAKPRENRDRSNILEIAKHNTEGGKAMRGLVRRRVLTANEFISDSSEKITKIRQTSTANKTYYTLIDANGAAVKTITANKKHKGSPDGLIDVSTGEEIEETTSLRPKARPLGRP
jgi:GH24 family phage-related lysozyme (muramidase)